MSLNNENLKYSYNERYPRINRAHGRGDGVDRKHLPNYFKLGEFDQTFIDMVLNVYSATKEINHIGTVENYEMSIMSPLRTYFPETYRQIILQSPMTDGSFEKDYVRFDRYPDILEKIKQFIKGITFYRARIAVLPAGDVLDWHIDTNTSILSRVHFVISESTRWFIDRRGDIEEKILKRGEIWFTNTGYRHKVINDSKFDRIVLTIGCNSKDLCQHWNISNDH